MTYSATEKHDVMVGRRDRLNGGSIRFMSAGGAVVASVPLDAVCGSVAANTAALVFAGFPKAVTPAVTGTAIAAADLVDSSGTVRKSGVSVGLAGSGAQFILSKLTPSAGDTLLVNAPLSLTDL